MRRERAPLHRVTLRMLLSGSLLVSGGLPVSGCAGTAELNNQIQTARRERDVLRDAYEAQRLRLKELELRLLKLEDRGLVQGTKEQSSHSTRAPALSTSHSPSESTGYRSASNGDWSARRLRALPVVRVSAAQSLSAAGESDYPRESRRRNSRTRSSQEEARSTSRPRSATRVVKRERRVGSTATQTQRSRSRERTPTLSEHNLSHYQRPEERQPESNISQREVTSSGEQSSQANPQPAQHIERRASQQAIETHPKEAVPPAEPTLEGAPLLLKLAVEHRQRGQRAQAMRLMQRLISDSPTHPLVPDALYLMGRLQIELGQLSQGRATLLRLSRLYPNAHAAQDAKRFLSEAR